MSDFNAFRDAQRQRIKNWEASARMAIGAKKAPGTKRTMSVAEAEARLKRLTKGR